MEASFSCDDQAPAVLLDPLFATVQERRLFGDGKFFADAVARRATTSIVADFARIAPLDDANLRDFVLANFDLPTEQPSPMVPPGLPLRAHIAATWDALARPAVAARGSALAVDCAHVVPGGRFREAYYWDSYFTLLGLARDRPALAEATVDALTGLIERHGHVPNGARSYYLTRSQPPLYALMPVLTGSGMTPRRRAAAMVEYRWWMGGARAVTLSDGAVLNRYWDEADRPRDEAWTEDVAVAARSGRPADEVFRDLRAGAESGWDFSSRWLGGTDLASIRTTRILPVDLNALLYAVEVTLGLHAEAAARRSAINRHLWLVGEGRYADHDLDHGPTSQVSAATLVPLFAGCASAGQAAAVAGLTERLLLAPGGLRTTLTCSGEQWDTPNGWAPLHWFAIVGLRRYGHDALAQRIADAWLGTVERHFAATGRLLEKYDVETGGAGGGGEYPVQDGFGWTNGVTAALLDTRA